MERLTYGNLSNMTQLYFILFAKQAEISIIFRSPKYRLLTISLKLCHRNISGTVNSVQNLTRRDAATFIYIYIFAKKHVHYVSLVYACPFTSI